MTNSEKANVSFVILLGTIFLALSLATNINAQTLPGAMLKVDDPAITTTTRYAKYSQPFMSLIDDVVASYPPGEGKPTLNGPCQQTCDALKCFGKCDKSEMIAELAKCEQAIFEADAVVAKIQNSISKTNGKGVSRSCDCCPASESMSPNCTAATEADYSCDAFDEYCEQVAEILAVTLQQSEPQAQKRAIQAALKMVAEKSKSQLQQQLAKSQQEASAKSDTLSARIDRLEQIVSNQRPDENVVTMLQKITTRQQQMLSQLNSLSNKNNVLARQVQALSNPQKIGASDMLEQIKRMELEALRQQEVARLKGEMKKLDQQIEKLMNPVQPAGFLEPLHVSEGMFEPLPATNRLDEKGINRRR